MSFETESLKKQFQLNIVLKIDGVYYSQYQVDTGLVIDSNKVGLVNTVRINPFSVNIRSVRTSIQSASFTLLDKDGLISSTLGSSPTQMMNVEVVMYVGYITGAFDFADYQEISRTTTKSVSKSSNTYSFNSTEVIDFVNEDIYTTAETLNTDINAVATTIPVQGDIIESFPASGSIKINNEFMQYTGKTLSDLTGVARGDRGTTAEDHDSGDEIQLVADIGPINPITAMLQLMVSPGGGGVYDVLADGLGIDESLIDIAKFESIRTDYFSGDEYELVLYDVGNALKYLEKEIMLPTNTRIFAKNGKISLAILDQIDIGAILPTIDESTIVSDPRWQLGSDKIVNSILMKYDYDEASKKYTRTKLFENADSIATYGRKKTLTYSFKAVRAALNGASIVSVMASRLLSRLSTPRGDIKLSTHMDTIGNDIADQVNVVHRYLPQEGAGLGFNSQMEILSKAIDFNTGKVSFDLQFTSYSGLRIGLIAPSPLIQSLTSQSVFTVPDGSCYGVGFAIRLFDPITNTYPDSQVVTILSIDGNEITVNEDF